MVKFFHTQWKLLPFNVIKSPKFLFLFPLVRTYEFKIYKGRSTFETSSPRQYSFDFHNVFIFKYFISIEDLHKRLLFNAMCCGGVWRDLVIVSRRVFVLLICWLKLTCYLFLIMFTEIYKKVKMCSKKGYSNNTLITVCKNTVSIS